MALKIENLIINEARTRIDADVEKTSFLGEDWKAKFRIVSRQAIEKGKEQDFLKQIADRKKEWRPGKKNQVLPLNGINAQGFIIDFEQLETGIL
jgi:hypothetical protein